MLRTIAEHPVAMRARHIVILLAISAALLLPKISAVVMHLHPGILTTVICTGSEMLTIHVGANGEPIEVAEGDHAPCVMADPGALDATPVTAWNAAPRSYRYGFNNLSRVGSTDAELGLLPDLRGPPDVI